MRHITPQQVASLKTLFLRSPDGSITWENFISRVNYHHSYISLNWCGMFVGIEEDGYAHS